MSELVNDYVSYSSQWVKRVSVWDWVRGWVSKWTCELRQLVSKAIHGVSEYVIYVS